VAKKVKAGKALPHSGTPVTRTTAKEWKEIRNEIERTYAYLRKKYPEIHGKVVDFVQQSISDGILYVGIRFIDKTLFSLRYACDMSIVTADYLDGKTGDYKIIREYMKPIPR